MTHDELLTKLSQDWNGTPYLLQALEAVVELHKPYPNYNDCAQCGYITEITGGGLAVPYPCPTIQAIEKELV